MKQNFLTHYCASIYINVLQLKLLLHITDCLPWLITFIVIIVIILIIDIALFLLLWIMDTKGLISGNICTYIHAYVCTYTYVHVFTCNCV